MTNATSTRTLSFVLAVTFTFILLVASTVSAVVVVTPATDFGATTSATDVDVQGTAKGTTTTATANVAAGGANPDSPSQTILVGDSSIFTVGQAITTSPGLPANTWVRAIPDGTTVRVDGSGLPWGFNKTYTIAAGYMNVKSGDTLTAYEQVSAQPTADVNNLQLSGPGSAVTLAGGATLSIYGTLSRTGGSTAIGSISGGTGIKAGTLNADLTVSTPVANDSLQLNTPILANGTGGLTKTGPGTLRIAQNYSAASYTGKTVVNGGTLAYYVTSNGEIPFGVTPGAFQADNITLAGGTTLQMNALNNNQSTTINANRGITLGVGTVTIERVGQVNLTMNSVITGNGGLYFKSNITNDAGGTNYINLNAANTYTGDTTFSWGPVITTGSAQKGWTVVIGNKDAFQNSTVDWTNVGMPAENAARPYKLSFGAGNVTYVFGGLKGNRDINSANNPGIGNAGQTIAIGNNNQDTQYDGILAFGATNLEKIGNGTLTLTKANTYTGTTTITDGTLELSSTGSLAAGSSVILNGGFLGGEGTVNGTITLAAGGGAVAPGGSIGTLFGSSLTWNSDDLLAGMAFELSTIDNTSDLLDLSGAFTKGTGSSFLFDFTGGLTGQTYTLVNFASSPGFSVGDFGVGSGIGGTFILNGTNLQFTASAGGGAVPEPSTFILAALGLLGWGLFCRRRRNR